MKSGSFTDTARAMSEENVERSYRVAEAFNRRDVEGFLALMDQEVEVVSRLAAMEGGYHGHDGVRRWWANLLGVIPDFTISDVEVRVPDGSDDLTFCLLRNRGHGGESAAPLEETLYLLMRWHAGRCVWWKVFLTEQEALEAAELLG
jgi:hypothetical protein